MLSMNLTDRFSSEKTLSVKRTINWKEAFVITGCLAVFGLAFSTGPMGVTPLLFLKAVYAKFSLNASDINPRFLDIIWEIRAPRIILSALTGAALAVSGAALQAIFRNPLVDPYLMGISAGAALGCSVSVIFFPLISVQPFAFLAAFLASFLTYGLAKSQGNVSRLHLILSGIVVSAFLMALVSLIKFLVSPHQLADIVTWLMGSFALSNWDKVVSSAPFILIGCLLIHLLRFRLNILSLSEEEARSLGVSVERERALVIGAISLSVGAAVSVSGIIGWVGLMVPHLVRLAIGPENRRLIPLSMVAGAGLMTLSDTIARSVTTFDLPVGIITALCGVPFFIYLMKRDNMRSWKQ